jgi:actin-like ATPase involved in cell morphogenesis
MTINASASVPKSLIEMIRNKRGCYSMKLGVDIGTSFSSVAVVIDGKLEMVKLSTGACAFGDSYSMPTAIYMDNGGVLLGQAAFNKRINDPSRFKSEFKRDFGTLTPYLIGGEEYLPEHIYTELFLHFKNQTTQQTGEEIDEVYITHPANYGNSKKLLLKKAASNAGLLNIEFVDEPTAAAIGYSQKNKINDGDILLVYDLGGGTFDVALIKKTTQGYIHLTEPLGISQCGGVDFDRAIYDDVMKKLKESGRFDMDRLMSEKRFNATLSEICIQIKHQLSQTEVHTQPIAIGFDYFDYSISKKEFEELIYPLVNRTCEKIKDVIYNAGLTSSDIDKVLLVGGSSRVPLVREMVANTLGNKIALDADPELTICQGAVSVVFIKENEQEQQRLEIEKQQRLVKEEQDRIMKLRNQLEEEQLRMKEEQLQMEIIKKQQESEQRRIKEEQVQREISQRQNVEEQNRAKELLKESTNIKTNSSHKTGLSFRIRGYSDYIKDNVPFMLKGLKIVMKIDDKYEVEIPPNPTQFIELSSGQHQLYVYRINCGMRQCKTLCKIDLKENENAVIEIKPVAWAWEAFKLYYNNKMIN